MHRGVSKGKKYHGANHTQGAERHLQESTKSHKSVEAKVTSTTKEKPLARRIRGHERMEEKTDIV